MQNIVKKISMKQLVANVGKFIPTKEIPVEGKPGVVKEVPAIGETVWLVNVVGIARGVKRGESNYGLWEALMGDFVAVPMVGEKKDKRFRTGQIFLPDVVLNLVAGALGNNNGVEFAFKIGITAVATDGERPPRQTIRSKRSLPPRCPILRRFRIPTPRSPGRTTPPIRLRKSPPKPARNKFARARASRPA